MTVQERLNAAKKLKLCLNCLKNSHLSWNCKKRKCIKCQKPHNYLLHLEFQKQGNAEQANATVGAKTRDTSGGQGDVTCRNTGEAAQSPTSSTTVNNHTIHDSTASVSSQVLLATALITININNKSVTCRVLLDSGSQSNFITEKVCKELDLQPIKINHTVKGIGQNVANINKRVSIPIL